MIYKIKHSTNENVVGFFPPVGNYIGYNDYSSPYSYSSISWGRVDPDLISIPQFVFEKKGKPTNVTSGPNYAFLFIDEKTTDLFLMFDLDDFQTFHTYIHKGEKSILYNILYMYLDRSHDYIDWHKTSFMHYHPLSNETFGEIKFDNFSSYQEYKNLLFKKNFFREQLKVQRVVFNESFIKFDLFRMSAISNGYYCSEKLKDTLTQAGVTGIEFIQVDNLKFHTTEL